MLSVATKTIGLERLAPVPFFAPSTPHCLSLVPTKKRTSDDLLGIVAALSREMKAV